MVRFMIVFVLLSIPLSVYTQKEESDIEGFSRTTSTIIEKEFTPIAKIKAGKGLSKRILKLELLKVTDLLKSKSEFAISFSFFEPGTYTYGDEKYGYVDQSDISAFVNFLDLLLNDFTKKTYTNYKEYSFQTNGGFKAGAFCSENTWRYFVKLEKYDSKSQIFMTQIQFDALYRKAKEANESIK